MADPTTWLITGCSRGLGSALAEAALQRGDRVVATARDVSSLDSLVEKYPGAAIALPLDVTDPQQIALVVSTAVGRLGRIDVLVNNAGYAHLSSVEDTTADDFTTLLGVNFLGTVHMTKALLPVMRTQGGGRIVNISSVGARLGTPGLAAYQAAKWAVSGFSEVLAQEVAHLGIAVTAIEPGSMPTDWAGSSMTIPTPSAPYAPLIDQVSAAIRTGGPALADLHQVARAILEIADSETPPTRLLLGSDALTVSRHYAQSLADSDAAWSELSRSTDRDDATDADRDPFGQTSQ
jgi:NAD(P)-dependent dehydrogenase (short-subunit alcohol dehydrogenase family)